MPAIFTLLVLLVLRLLRDGINAVADSLQVSNTTSINATDTVLSMALCIMVYLSCGIVASSIILEAKFGTRWIIVMYGTLVLPMEVCCIVQVLYESKSMTTTGSFDSIPVTSVCCCHRISLVGFVLDCSTVRYYVQIHSKGMGPKKKSLWKCDVFE
jgi:hypothetical protein